MSSPFLERFSYHIVRGLIARDLLEVSSGAEAAVIRDVAAFLGKAHNRSLISSLVQALVVHPKVEELYAEDDDIKALVEGLDPSVVRG